MLKVTCLLCENLPTPRKTELYSTLIAKSDEEAMKNLGEVMTKHITRHHSQALEEIAASMPMWATFNLLKYFDEVGLDESKYEIEKEKIRDSLAEMLMYGAEEEDEGEEDGEEEEIDFEDEEGEELEEDETLEDSTT